MIFNLIRDVYIKPLENLGEKQRKKELYNYVLSKGVPFDSDKALEILANKVGMTMSGAFLASDLKKDNVRLEKNKEYVLSIYSSEYNSMIQDFIYMTNGDFLLNSSKLTSLLSDVKYSNAKGHAIYLKINENREEEVKDEQNTGTWENTKNPRNNGEYIIIPYERNITNK